MTNKCIYHRYYEYNIIAMTKLFGVQLPAKDGNNTEWVLNYRKTSNISRTLIGNEIVDNSDVVGASPVGAAPTTSSFST